MMGFQLGSLFPLGSRPCTWYDLSGPWRKVGTRMCSYIAMKTGAGTTASRLGMADLGIAQLHDMKEHADMIANLDPLGPPLIADMDTGYGGKPVPSPSSRISIWTLLTQRRSNHGIQGRWRVHSCRCRRIPH